MRIIDGIVGGMLCGRSGCGKYVCAFVCVSRSQITTCTVEYPTRIQHVDCVPCVVVEDQVISDNLTDILLLHLSPLRKTINHEPTEKVQGDHVEISLATPFLTELMVTGIE